MNKVLLSLMSIALLSLSACGSSDSPLATSGNNNPPALNVSTIDGGTASLLGIWRSSCHSGGISDTNFIMNFTASSYVAISGWGGSGVNSTSPPVRQDGTGLLGTNQSFSKLTATITSSDYPADYPVGGTLDFGVVIDNSGSIDVFYTATEQTPGNAVYYGYAQFYSRQ